LPEKGLEPLAEFINGTVGATLMSLDEEAAGISPGEDSEVEEALKVPPTSWLKKYPRS